MQVELPSRNDARCDTSLDPFLTDLCVVMFKYIYYMHVGVGVCIDVYHNLYKVYTSVSMYGCDFSFRILFYLSSALC